MPVDQYDLQSLADAYRHRPELNLLQTLRTTFTISGLTVDQREILNRRWLRIYTTNYDDAAELAYHQNSIAVSSFNYDDDKPPRVPRGAIIHLHGIIRKATEENVLEQLVLGRQSYVRQYFSRTPWYDEFIRDLTFSQATYFVGYGLRDPHVTALMAQPEITKAKTYFILKGPVDQLTIDHIKDYGEPHDIEVRGFAQLCRTLPAAGPATDLNTLRALRYVDPMKDKRAVLKPTPLEVINLVTFGTFNGQRCLTSLPKSEYVISREAVAREALKQIAANTTLVIHSRLGNGKSIFLWILAFHLSSTGYRCFFCNAANSAVEFELRSLLEEEKVVIFFDSYDVAIDIIDRCHELLPKAKFVVSVRTGIQEVRLHEITTRLPNPIGRLSLNIFTSEEKVDFTGLLESVGALKDDLRNRIRNCGDLREVVTTIYENREIQQRIKQSLQPILNDRSSASILILGLILSSIGFSGDVSFYLDVTNSDPQVVLSKHREVFSDIFRSEDGQIQARSPIYSEYLLQNVLMADEVINAIELSLVVAVQRKRERKYRAILGNLMRFTQMSRLLKATPESRSKIIALYNRLQRDIGIREEPLFWLQFAIAMIDDGQLPIAEGFLSNAYEKARQAPGIYETYQIDTQALRLLLLIEAEGAKGKEVERFEKIMRTGELVKNMIADRAHRSYAVRVLEGFPVFIKNRSDDLSIPQKNRLVKLFHELSNALVGLSPSERAETAADIMRGQLAEAIKVLIVT